MTAAHDALGVAALRVGFVLMAIAAGSDTAFALLDGGGLLSAVEGVAMTALALAGVVRAESAARLLRPPGRVLLCAGAFAVAGALDWGVQEHFPEVAPAIVWLAAIVSSSAWLTGCVVLSAAGYVVDLLLDGHSPSWLLTALGQEMIVNQIVDLVANAAAVFVLNLLLRRFLTAVPVSLQEARAGYADELTPELVALVRAPLRASLPRADPASLIAQLSAAELRVLASLAEGRTPTQVAFDSGRQLATVRTHIAAIKHKTGARTVEQAVGLYAQASRVD